MYLIRKIIMKKNIFIIVALMCICFVACKEDVGGNPIDIPSDTIDVPIDTAQYPIIIAPLQEIDSIPGVYFYENFSNGYQLLPAIWNMPTHMWRYIYIINSEEELNTINPYPFGIPVNIDFSKYTIIGGREMGSNGSAVFITATLTEHKEYYLFEIYMKYPDGVFTVFSDVYVWRLYPKLNSKKDIITTLTEDYG